MPLLLPYRRSVARFLLLVFGLLWFNSVAFRHAHRLPGGRVIVHAHPYKPVGNSPYQPNTHTAQELVWLDTLSQPVFDVPALTGLLASLTFLLIIRGLPAKSAFSYFRIPLRIPQRGPPFR